MGGASYDERWLKGVEDNTVRYTTLRISERGRSTRGG